MKILITGSNGLLGQKIVLHCLKHKIDFIATSKGVNRFAKCPDSLFVSLDITSEKEIVDLVNIHQPTHIINTAAVTNVDFCESNQALCQQVNVKAVAYLFKVCEQHKIHFIQLSTDFVFDGKKGSYKESDPVNPLSVYAKSKVDSENILLKGTYTNWAILRTIIVFGEGENLSRSNIVLWAKSALEKGDPLTIVDDQFRAPTWASDLAWACVKTAELKARGIYHISGPETFSIYELVRRIALYYGFNFNQVESISSLSLNQAAKRPPKTGFDIGKARKVLGYNPKSFEESLSCL